MDQLITLADEGLYCAPGNFYVDPHRAVQTALITHGHSDHARTGHQSYYCASSSLGILRHRLGKRPVIHPILYGERRKFGEVWVSLHPAGHILGSAQVRIEYKGRVTVISGDFKRDPDPTCGLFEVIECDTFITEATFGLPVYRWPPTSNVAKEILKWWAKNCSDGVVSLLFCYSLGKAQRILAELKVLTDVPIFVHESLEAVNCIYREAGASLPATIPIKKAEDFSSEDILSRSGLVLLPPSSKSMWLAEKLNLYETAFASGWMQLRNVQLAGSYDRGFVISDHADWPSLVHTAHETKAKTVLVTHGNAAPLVRTLQDQGLQAFDLETYFL